MLPNPVVNVIDADRRWHGFEIREPQRLDCVAQPSFVRQGLTTLAYEIASPGNGVSHGASMTRHAPEYHPAERRHSPGRLQPRAKRDVCDG
jgi:hypothetical protein